MLVNRHLNHHSVKVLSNTVQDGVRGVLLSRSVKGVSKDHYSFQTIPGDLPIISAIGDGKQLAFHKSRNGGTLTFLPSEDQVKVISEK